MSLEKRVYHAPTINSMELKGFRLNISYEKLDKDYIPQSQPAKNATEMREIFRKGHAALCGIPKSRPAKNIEEMLSVFSNVLILDISKK